MTRTGSSLISRKSGDLAILDRFTPAVIDDMGNLNEVVQLDCIATSLQALVKKLGLTLVEQNRVAEVRLRAKRRAGEILQQIVPHGGDRRSKDRDPKPTLRALGIENHQCAEWKRIASLPKKTFEKYVKEVKEKEVELTTKEIVEFARVFRKEKARKQRFKAAAAYAEAYREEEIILADMRDIETVLEDGSADLVFCDPEYNDLGAFEKVAELAARKLKEGGLCLVYSGVLRMDRVYEAMGKHLRYWWTFRQDLNGPFSLIYTRNVESRWKPIIAYCRPPLRPAPLKVIDSLKGGGCEKDLHEWQQAEQEASYLIDLLTQPADLVVDLCCGSGTIPAAAKRLGRRWLGFEIDREHAARARKRVAETVVDVEVGSTKTQRSGKRG